MKQKLNTRFKPKEAEGGWLKWIWNKWFTAFIKTWEKVEINASQIQIPIQLWKKSNGIKEELEGIKMKLYGNCCYILGLGESNEIHILQCNPMFRKIYPTPSLLNPICSDLLPPLMN